MWLYCIHTSFFSVFCVSWETIGSLLNFQEVILSSDDDEGEVGSSFWYNFTFLYLVMTVFICLKYTVTHRYMMQSSFLCSCIESSHTTLRRVKRDNGYLQSAY